MARGRTEQIMATRFDADRAMDVEPSGAGGHSGRRPDEVLVEEPLEIRFDDRPVATTMRTPGHDFELATGWCWAEGLLTSAPEEVRYCATGSALDNDFNVVLVDPGPAALATGAALGVSTPRMGLVSSSCGICGVEQIDGLTERLSPLVAATWSAATVGSIGEAVRDRQELFAATGGSHAAAAVGPDGTVLVVREDIGRHNAVDKVVGRLVLDDRLPGERDILWTSGRASFEMVQKSWAAGFSILVAVGAPSALAVRTAEAAGMVLAAFVRDGRLTAYTGASMVSG